MTSFNIQRRLYDDQFSLAAPPWSSSSAIRPLSTRQHHRPSGTPARSVHPPIPSRSGEAEGPVVYPEELTAASASGRVPRTNESVGCVPLAPLPLLCRGGLTPHAGAVMGVRRQYGPCVRRWS